MHIRPTSVCKARGNTVATKKLVIQFEKVARLTAVPMTWIGNISVINVHGGLDMPIESNYKKTRSPTNAIIDPE
jgi:hypothetical protein